MKKRKAGILLILIGVGIPLVLFFFQDDGNINLDNRRVKTIERELTPKEIESLKALIEHELPLLSLKPKKIPKETFSYEELDFMAELYVLLLGEGKSNVSKWLVDNYLKKKKWVITTGRHFYIPYQYFIGIGIIFVLIGFGTLIFSFFPKGDKANPKK